MTWFTLLMGAPWVHAGEWYRYYDDNGVLVMSHHVPADRAHKGYTVVNDSGRVLRVVARQLTPAEIAVRDRELARQAELEAQRQEALAHDRRLMELYATPEEVEFARDSKLEDIDQLIATLRSDIQQLRVDQRRYETQAAEKERGQLPVSPEILENLEAVRYQITSKEKEIETRRAEQEDIRAKYDHDLDRIYELYGLPRPVEVAG